MKFNGVLKSSCFEFADVGLAQQPSYKSLEKKVDTLSLKSIDILYMGYDKLV